MPSMCLKTLFMIKYIQTCEANVDNITSLMVNHIDNDRGRVERTGRSGVEGTGAPDAGAEEWLCIYFPDGMRSRRSIMRLKKKI